MLRLSLWLLAGTMALQLISFPPDADAFVALVAVVAALLVVLLPRLRRRDIAIGLVGASYFLVHVTLVANSRLERPFEGDSMLVHVRIVDFPRHSESMTAFQASPLDDVRMPPRFWLSWYEPPVEPELGDVWRLELRLRRPTGTRNPGSPDFEARATYQRIGARGYVVNGRHNRLVDSRTERGVDRIRRHFVSRLETVLRGNDERAVLAAIVVGARHLLSAKQWERYANTGTSHLMAISGLHVGLAAGAAYLVAAAVFGLVAARGGAREMALIASAATAVAYAAVSGFAVPAARAMLMLLIGVAALLLRRELCAARLLATALVLLIAVDPLATMAPGFRLSFAAVAWLIWCAKRRPVQAGHRLLRPLFAIRALWSIQLLLLAGLLPLSALLFRQVALAAPGVNLLALPVFSVVTVPLALAGLLLDGPLAPIGDSALRGAAHSVTWLDALIGEAARHAAAAAVADTDGRALLLLAVPVVWALLPPGWPGRAAAWIGVAALLAWRPPGPPWGCADIVALDVGQGLAVAVRTQAHTMLYDTGPAYRSGGSAAERIVLPYLRSRGVTTLDRIVVSHADLDHAGGVSPIVESLPVSDVLGGEEMPVPGAAVGRCAAGMRWRWDAIDFEILHPQPGSAADGNSASCVVLIEAGRRRFLLTGDIESDVETRLVQRRTLPAVDGLTVPHHGSRTSSTTPFVQALGAELAIVSAAAGNQWGFPKPDVVARWRAYGARVLDTATGGAISLRLCRGAPIANVSEYRHRVRRVWNDRAPPFPP